MNAARENGRYSKVSRRMWNDQHFRNLTAPPPCGQFLWVRLLSGPELANIPGLFSTTESHLAEALGWSLEGFREAFAEVLREGMAKADWKARLVWVPKAILHNLPGNPNVVKSWRTMWVELPECALKTEAYMELYEHMKDMGKAFQKAFEEAFRKPSVKPSLKDMANQEQEQEQEQDHRGDPGDGAGKPPVVTVVGDDIQKLKPETGRLPKPVVAFERTFWISGYERAVDDERGPKHDKYVFPDKAFSALVSVVEKHCEGDDRQKIDQWVYGRVRQFVRAVLDGPKESWVWSSLGPDGLLKWHNEGRPGFKKPKKSPPPPPPAAAPRSPEETLLPLNSPETAAEVAQLLKELASG
jgi:hypothetical protein